MPTPDAARDRAVDAPSPTTEGPSSPVDSRADQRLAVWALATFHAVAVVLILLTLVHAAGNLTTLLGTVNTVAGFFLFGALWAASWFSTGRALAPIYRALERGESPSSLGVRALANGALWGGASGLLFLLALPTLSLFYAFVSPPDGAFQTADALRAAIAGFGLFLGFGGVVAFLIGAVVGVVFALVDWLLLLLAN